MSTADGLFPMQARPPLHEHDRVVVACVWGDEPGLVKSVLTGPRAGLVSVKLDRGDLVEIDSARVRQV